MANIPRWMKILFVMKAVFAVVILLAMNGMITFGERSLVAANEGPKEQDAVPDNNATNPAPADQTKTSPAVAQNATDDGYQDAEKPKSARKSFLDELFSVPDVNTENMQKEEAGRYLTMVDKKKKQVEERISLLQARETRLLDIEHSIDDKLKRLDEEKRFFLDTVQKEKTMSEERTAQLVEFYKKMPPKAAAPVFEKMDKDLVVYLMNKLPQKQITNILALLKPETSVKLTEYYGRLRSGKEYELLREINKSLSDEFTNCKGM